MVNKDFQIFNTTYSLSDKHNGENKWSTVVKALTHSPEVVEVGDGDVVVVVVAAATANNVRMDKGIAVVAM